MSTPGNEFRETEYLGLGFLAVKSSELINNLMLGAHIGDDDKYTLRRAENFLRDLSSGAKLVTSGGNSNASAIDNVRKLSYSVEPLMLMQAQIQVAEVEEAFMEMASAIESALETNNPDEIKQNELDRAKEFFKILHSSLINTVERSQHRFGGIDLSLSNHA